MRKLAEEERRLQSVNELKRLSLPARSATWLVGTLATAALFLLGFIAAA